MLSERNQILKDLGYDLIYSRKYKLIYINRKLINGCFGEGEWEQVEREERITEEQWIY